MCMHIHLNLRTTGFSKQIRQLQLAVFTELEELQSHNRSVNVQKHIKFYTQVFDASNPCT